MHFRGAPSVSQTVDLKLNFRQLRRETSCFVTRLRPPAQREATCRLKGKMKDTQGKKLKRSAKSFYGLCSTTFQHPPRSKPPGPPENPAAQAPHAEHLPDLGQPVELAGQSTETQAQPSKSNASHASIQSQQPYSGERGLGRC